MKIRKLNEQEFKSEKQKILSILLEWKETSWIDLQKMVEKLGLKNSTWLEKKPSGLLHTWRESVDDMIEFLNKEQEIYNEGFTFFIAENEDDDNKIQGIAMGYGPRKRGGYCNNFFGINPGTYFEIDEMIIAEPHIFSRAFPTEYNGPFERVGKALLQTIVHHVSNIDTPYPISAQPHHANDNAHDFFGKNLFKLGCGSMGHTYVLEVTDFPVLNQNFQDDSKQTCIKNI